ncbi:hypothetical protein BGZ73_007940 [Actinomortierella ambigua]|nr:hypothetical protein BGZ73_007940 [Actinomortierella ambigua]
MATEGAIDLEKQQQQPTTPGEATVALSRVELVPLTQRVVEILKTYTKFGYTSFGGPTVHVALLHDEIVAKRNWVSNEQFVELFAISQALPGPGSTELAYSLALVRNGFICVMTVTGALIGTVSGSIPLWAERLEQGLASAAIGLVALAAYRMSTTLATDKLTRILALLSGGVTALYSSAWLLPVVMATGGLCSLAFDALWVPFITKRRKESQSLLETKADLQQDADKNEPTAESTIPSGSSIEPNDEQHRPTSEEPDDLDKDSGEDATSSASVQTPTLYKYSGKLAFGILAAFLALLIAVIVVRAVVSVPPKADYGYLAATFYFVGSIIFGGGPVIIPLLRTYMVEPQWMTDSQFLVGLALIQALPGPNFNFAAFLGAVAMMNSTSRSVGASIAGAIICFIGIFAPGLMLKSAVIPFWQAVRDRPAVKMVFRGVNAAALGLVFSAIWLIWVQIIKPGGSDGYHAVIASAGFVAAGYLGFPAPLVIILGGVMGAIEYAVEK